MEKWGNMKYIRKIGNIRNIEQEMPNMLEGKIGNIRNIGQEMPYMLEGKFLYNV